MSTQAAGAVPRVLLTRSTEDCAEWAEALEQQGLLPVIFPCITAEPLDTPQLRAALRADLEHADWVVLTSRRGVAAFATLAADTLGAHTRVAVVGPATAQAARAMLGRADHVGGGTAARLAASLPADPNLTPGARLVLALAANAPALLERGLAAAGARCRRFDVYRTVPAPARSPKAPLSALRADRILFASPSAVEGFSNQIEMDAAADVYTIGPTTSAAARSRGIIVKGEAREPSLEGLLEAMHG